MQNEQSGGCLCGEVRYTFKADPALSFSCHCRDCQRATGSVCASAFAVPKSSLQLSGEYKYFNKLGDDGREVSRGFCPICGSRVVSMLGALKFSLFLVSRHSYLPAHAPDPKSA